MIPTHQLSKTGSHGLRTRETLKIWSRSTAVNDPTEPREQIEIRPCPNPRDLYRSSISISASGVSAGFPKLVQSTRVRVVHVPTACHRYASSTTSSTCGYFLHLIRPLRFREMHTLHMLNTCVRSYDKAQDARKSSPRPP